MKSSEREHYEEVFQSLSRVELQKDMSPLDELAIDDLFGPQDDLWLGFYTKRGIEIALERYGVLADIRKLGFEELEIELQLSDPEEQMLRIWSIEPSYDVPLLELVVSRDILHLKDELAGRMASDHATVLTVQWLLMQNPAAEFGSDRLPLPGQSMPGLGIGEQVMEILRNTCRRLDLSGLVTVPAHFHNAVMYGVNFRYISPNFEGCLRALERDVLPEVGGSLAAASWALHWHMVIDQASPTDEPFEWFHEAMLCPIDEAFTRYFHSETYLEESEAARKGHRFDVFSQALRRNLSSRGLVPFDAEQVARWLE